MSSEHEITALIRSFCELTGVGICFYDTEHFFHYNRTGAREYMGHYCDFCRFVRSLPGGRLACDKSDHEEAVKLARAYEKPFFHRCHMGLCELVVPVLRRGRLLGTVFVGQCRIEEEDSVAEVVAGARERGGDEAQFVDLYRALPSIRREHLIAMGDLIHLYFSRMSDGVSFFGGEGTVEKGSVAERIYKYIEGNYHRELSPRHISERFFLNPSYMARLFRREMGMSVGECIRQVRHRNACRLLRNSAVPIGSIALNVGYMDTNYFCRVFKSLEGITPTEYRNRNG